MTQFDFIAQAWLEPRMPSEFTVLDEDESDFDEERDFDDSERFHPPEPRMDPQTGQWWYAEDQDEDWQREQSFDEDNDDENEPQFYK